MADRPPPRAGAVAAPDASTPPTAPERPESSSGGSRWRPSWRRGQVVLLVVVLAAVAVLAYVNRGAFDLGRWVYLLRPAWLVVAVVASGLTIVGNALNLIGASPMRLRFGPTCAVQATGTVARLISPAAVGGAAVNVQYLRRTGASGVAAVGAVTVAQVVQLVTTFVLLVPLGLAAGTSLAPLRGRGVLLAVGATLVAVAVVAGILFVRRSGRQAERVRRLARDVTTSLRTMAAEPRRAFVSAGGSVVISLGLTGSLWASVHAFGGTLGLPVVMAALLLGSTAGNAVPVPGGLGSVDAALVAALVASGARLEVALPAVILHRLVTLWLQVPVGLACLPWLRRRELL